MVGEPSQPAEVSPIATPAVSSEREGELARNDGAEEPIGKDSPVIQPYLEIVGRSLECDCGFEARLLHPNDRVGGEVIDQAECIRAVRAEENVRAARVSPA